MNSYARQMCLTKRIVEKNCRQHKGDCSTCKYCRLCKQYCNYGLRNLTEEEIKKQFRSTEKIRGYTYG